MRKQSIAAFIMVTLIVLLGATQSMASNSSLPPEDGGVPVTIVPSSLEGIESLEEDVLVGIVTDALQLSSKGDTYREAKVRVLHDAGKPNSLIVYLLHEDTYSFETVKIVLGKNYSVLSVERDYVEQASDYPVEKGITSTCPNNKIEVLLTTCEDRIPSAVEGINTSYYHAVNAGYEVKKIIGSGENTTNIKNWLSCPNLLYWGRIGHGNPNGVILDDATLNYTYFNTVDLQGKVLYFNSCKVFNNPLRNSILNNAKADKFIGGIPNLMVGPSEDVFKCWNYHNFPQDTPPGGQSDEMCYWVSACESATGYPLPGSHGCGGPALVFPEPTINDAEYVDQYVPTAIPAGTTTQVWIEMKNVGNTTWTRAEGYKLGSQNPRDNRTWGFGRVWLAPGEAIEPGDVKRFTFNITAPTEPGLYDFQWRMVQEFVEWFGDQTPNVRINVGPVPVYNDAEFIGQSAPTEVPVGGTIQGWVDMKNTGSATWTPDANYRLGSLTPYPGRIWLPLSPGDAIEHGQIKRFTFSFTAPPQPDTVVLQWRMAEGIDWIDWFGDTAPTVEITVSSCGGHGELACPGSQCDSGLQKCGDGRCWYCCGDGSINGICGTDWNGNSCSWDPSSPTYDADCTCPGTDHKWQSDYYGQTPYESPNQPNPPVCLSDDRCLHSNGSAVDHGTLSGTTWICSWYSIAGRSQGVWYQCEATRANANKIIEGYQCQQVGGGYEWVPVGQ